MIVWYKIETTFLLSFHKIILPVMRNQVKSGELPFFTCKPW
jgi:hypothetical protein